MTDSPAKRRKTSPTSSFPITATPGTPSNIPVLRQQQSATKPSINRPSFASPTRASLARHNPALLNNRPSGSRSPVRKNLQDVFAKALGEARTTTGGDEVATRAETSQQDVGDSRPTRTPGSGLSAKPRRMSRSPVKPTRDAERPPDASDLDGIVNPFGKRGLRRSPVSSSQAESARQDSQTEPASVQEDIDPFKKRTGLRRSPISSQVESSASLEEQPVKRAGLRRSPAILEPDFVAPEEQPVKRTGLRSSPATPQAGLIPWEEQPAKRTGLRSSPAIPQADATPQDPAIVRKPALRRSPLPSHAKILPVLPIPEPIEQEQMGIVKKNALRRSPIQELSKTPNDLLRQFSTTPPGLPPSKALQLSPAIVSNATADIPPVEVTHQVEDSALLNRLKESQQLEEPTISRPISTEVTGSVPVDKIMPKKAAIAKTKTPQTKSGSVRKSKRMSGPQPAAVSSAKSILREMHLDSPAEPEPELPPTPTQLGLADPIVTTPPTGIHNTPSRRAHRNKSLAGKLKSSPLKPRDERPAEAVPDAGTETTPIPSLIPDSQVSRQEKPKRRKSARFLIPEDPHAEKKKERDALLKELQQLQADIALGNKETERLRMLQESKAKTSSSQTTKDSAELAAMLLRSTAGGPAATPKPKPPSIFKSIEAFLPFRSRRRQIAKASMLPVLENPLPSLLPIEMEDPLPSLQAFTPLTYNSTISLLQATSSSTGVENDALPLQQHLIRASHPSGLFSSRLCLVVDTSNFSISSLEILKLDPAAEGELGAFLRQRAEKRELSVVCWAMGRWAEVALKRAGFWCAVHAEFGTREAMIKSLERSKPQPKKRKRAGTATLDEAEEMGADENEQQQGNWTRKQLLPQMSRTNFEVVNDENGILLRIEWQLKFDWTGEVESEISAMAKVPRSWQEKDDRNSLAKIPQTFQTLVKEKGPLSAVRTVVGLLMGDS